MVLLLIGIGMYLMGRMRMARLGINIKSVYAEIPPE